MFTHRGIRPSVQAGSRRSNCRLNSHHLTASQRGLSGFMVVEFVNTPTLLAMGESAIITNLKNRRTLIVLILVIGAVYFVLGDMNGFMSKSNLNKEIQVKQISSTEMSKARYTRKGSGAYIDWIDVELNQDEINNIVNWINSVPDSDRIALNQIPSNTSISAGIVFRLKTGREIRIQYDLEKIYITRTDIWTGQMIYTIDQENLRDFFDQQLKGFYFGEDKVNKS